MLSEENITAAVVSLPCWELFDNQTEDYKNYILGDVLKVGIEAGSEIGWHKYIESTGLFIGMNSFGASAPANELFKFFGFDPYDIKEKILKKIS